MKKQKRADILLVTDFLNIWKKQLTSEQGIRLRKRFEERSSRGCAARIVLDPTVLRSRLVHWNLHRVLLADELILPGERAHETEYITEFAQTLGHAGFSPRILEVRLCSGANWEELCDIVSRLLALLPSLQELALTSNQSG